MVHVKIVTQLEHDQLTPSALLVHDHLPRRPGSPCQADGIDLAPGGLLPGDLAVWNGHVAMIVGNGIDGRKGQESIGLQVTRRRQVIASALEAEVWGHLSVAIRELPVTDLVAVRPCQQHLFACPARGDSKCRGAAACPGTLVDLPRCCRKAITAAYRYVPWSGPIGRPAQNDAKR